MLRVEVVAKLRNALVWEAIRAAGSAQGLADLCGVSRVAIYHWGNMRLCPAKSKRDQVDRVFRELIGKGIDEVFPESLRKAVAFRRSPKIETRQVTLSDEALLTYGQHTAERLGANAANPPSTSLETAEVRGLLRSAVNRLSASHRQVIHERFPLDQDTDAATLTDIAESRGLSRQRVQQIERKGLRRLFANRQLANITGLLPDGEPPTCCAFCGKPFRNGAAARLHERECHSNSDLTINHMGSVSNVDSTSEEN